MHFEVFLKSPSENTLFPAWCLITPGQLLYIVWFWSVHTLWCEMSYGAIMESDTTAHALWSHITQTVFALRPFHLFKFTSFSSSQWVPSPVEPSGHSPHSHDPSGWVVHSTPGKHGFDSKHKSSSKQVTVTQCSARFPPVSIITSTVLGKKKCI